MNDRVRTRKEYDQVLESFIEGWNDIQEEIRPLTIYRNGSIGSPGVSDLDLILVFSDDFTDGAAFRSTYNQILKSIPDAPFYWVHDPIFLPRRLVNKLPAFSLNNPSDWELAMGVEIESEHNHPDTWQSKLISVEFLQMRLIHWLTMQQRPALLDQRGLLLRGHSLIHSLELARRAGLNMDESEFKALGIVENLRGTISDGEQVELTENECMKLLQRLIRECHLIYQAFASNVASGVHFYLPNGGSYEYQQGVELIRLFEHGILPKFRSSEKGCRLEGFHWVNRFMRDLYFLPRGKLSLGANTDLIRSVEDRSRFLREVWRWNASVFGTIHAGLGISPGVSGKVASKWASRYWGVVSRDDRNRGTDSI